MWLHAGLTLSASGVISGAATESGTYGPVFEVKDSAGRAATKQILLRILLNVTFNPSPFPEAIAGRFYWERKEVWGGEGPFTFTITSNSQPVPVGLSVVYSPTTGVTITGIPATAGTTHLEFSVRDETRLHTATQAYDFRVVSPLLIAPSSLPAAGVGFPYNVTLAVGGGTPPYTWGTANGIPSPPPGLTFDPATGILSGTPTTAGNFVTFLSVKDSGSPPQTAYAGSGVWVVDRLTITKPRMKDGVTGKVYPGDTMEAAGGQPPFTWSNVPQQYAPNNLPPGISLAAEGSLSGQPTTSGTYFPVIEVRDSSNPPRVATSSPLVVISPPLAIATTSLRDGIENLQYSADIGFTGGALPYTSRISSGSLPPGLIYIPSQFTVYFIPARIYGPLSGVGTYSFTVAVTDSSVPPDVVAQPFTIRVVPQLVFNPPASLPDGLEGTPYTAALSATGGVPPYHWSTVSAPSGLSIDSATGVLSGTPDQPWPSSVGIRMSDSTVPPQSVTRYVPLKIIEKLRTSTTLPPLIVGTPAHIQLGASGGTAPYRWTLVSGDLPAGLSFATSTGDITGTPSSADSQTFTVKLEDSGTTFPQSVQQALTLSTVTTQGRNDSIASATPLSNGTYYLSLSPADDSSGALNPDNDYFSVTANPGMVVGVVIRAELLTPSSPMDSVIELVDANGQRLIGCEFAPNGIGFYSYCLNDDDYSRSTLDSALYYKAPGSPGGAPVTFYVRVLDWSGMARPDFRYSITISGAN
ncbi:MAG: putative Ig domain-containing protein [Acidobacteria bacterium]|nr:putative Ig domain-containing protein [Acidobacteriota bacterium]